MDLREANKRFEVLVEWEGYDKSEATWEPLTVMCEDVPGLVRQFLESGVPDTKKKLLPSVLKLPVIRGLPQKGGSVVS